MKLLGLGDNTIDIYVDHGIEFPGGNAVNVSVFAKRLGAETSYLGCVGNDDRARLLIDSLSAEGVDVSRVRHLNEPNSWSRIRHNKEDRVFDGSHRIDLTQYNLDIDDFTYIQAHDHCHTSIYSGLENNLAAISEASRCLSFDFSEEFTAEQIQSIGLHLDIAFLSGAKKGLDECRKLAARLQALGCDKTVITRGAEGAMAIEDGIAVHTKPVPTDVVDTLGAGDGFIAGFLVALHTGTPFLDALAAGSESASRACSERGAFGYAATSKLAET